MHQRLENKKEKMQEIINTVNTITKGIEEMNNRQTKMNDTITEIKNTLEGFYSGITETKEWISELEDRMMKNTAVEQNLKKDYEKK